MTAPVLLLFILCQKIFYNFINNNIINTLWELFSSESIYTKLQHSVMLCVKYALDFNILLAGSPSNGAIGTSHKTSDV